MLSNQHFYHRIIRKLVVGFGSLFNDLKLYRYDKAGTTEIERVTVPLSYASKEKFYARITQDPTLAKEVALTLPRMSFEMLSIAYDPLRKMSSFNTSFGVGNNGNTLKTIPGATPYNFTFALYVYVRNTEDGAQIIEQILPYFNPDYTMTLDLTGTGLTKNDVPVILESIEPLNDYVGTSENVRTIQWTLTFTVKAWLYGPVNNNAKIIRKATANTYDSTYNVVGSRTVNLSSGSGQYKVDELVYEGKTLQTANASAFVRRWDNVANQIYLTDSSGQFMTGRKLVGAVSNASYTMSSFDTTDNQMINLTVLPKPSTANANNAYGFDISIEEYPYIT
jgi:hypothetical protein